MVVIAFVGCNEDGPVFCTSLYLLSNWAAGSHGATIIGTRARVSFRHFLPILPPLASITDHGCLGSCSYGDSGFPHGGLGSLINIFRRIIQFSNLIRTTTTPTPSLARSIIWTLLSSLIITQLFRSRRLPIIIHRRS